MDCIVLWIMESLMWKWRLFLQTWEYASIVRSGRRRRRRSRRRRGGRGGGQMEQRRSWFSRFRPRLKSFLVNQKQKNGSESTSSREAAASSKGVHPPALADDLASSITRQKVAAAKQYIENHYKSQMKNLQERKERYAKRSLSLSPVSLFSSGLLVPTGEAVQWRSSGNTISSALDSNLWISFACDFWHRINNSRIILSLLPAL